MSAIFARGERVEVCGSLGTVLERVVDLAGYGYYAVELDRGDKLLVEERAAQYPWA